MDWWQPIDIYCERRSTGFWAEPLNAWSNLAFWIAAAWTVPALRRAGRRLRGGLNTPGSEGHAEAIPGRENAPGSDGQSVDAAAGDLADGRNAEEHSRGGGGAWELVVLTGLLLGIGVGSFAFHTFAVPWAATVDVGMIVLWIAWFLWIYGRRVLHRPSWLVAIGIVVMFATSVVAARLSGHFIGAYAPVLAVLTALGLAARRAQRPRPNTLLVAAAVFTLSMTTAALDGPLCEYVPTGTHFIWHLLNATTLTLATLALAEQIIASSEDR
ncbi:MAG: hypothetical protein AAF333_00030 [Planctomycetota bacterium]